MIVTYQVLPSLLILIFKLVPIFIFIVLLLYYNQQDALFLDIPPLEQYVHILLEEMRIWELAETDLVLIGDYQLAIIK